VDKRRAVVKECALASFVKGGKSFPTNPSTRCILKAVEYVTGVSWSKSCIRRDLLALGFVPRVRRHAPSRSPKVFAKRLQFALKWVRCAADRVVFSDEHVFNTNDKSCRTQWVREGDRVYSRERKRVQSTQRLQVWGAISVGYKKLVVLPQTMQTGTARSQPFRLSAHGYISHCLEPNVPFPPMKVFMQDGARPHTANLTKQFLADRNVDYIEDWPPYSPDLNPIEQVWGILNLRVAALHPEGLDELSSAVKKCWAELSQRELNKCCRSFRRKLRACVENNGAM
jgi:transposase